MTYALITPGALLGIPFFPWGLLLVTIAYLAGLAYSICLAVANCREEKALARHTQEPEAKPDLDLWLAEDEIDWSEIRIWKRPKAVS